MTLATDKPRDHTNPYLFGSFLLLCLSAYYEFQATHLAPSSLALGPSLIYWSGITLIFPFALAIFWLSARSLKILAFMIPEKWDYLILGASLILALVASRYTAPGFYAPILWSVLLFRVPYETLRPSLLYLGLLLWLG